MVTPEMVIKMWNLLVPPNVIERQMSFPGISGAPLLSKMPGPRAIEAERPLPAPLELTVSSSIPKILAPATHGLWHSCPSATSVSSTCVSDSRLVSRHCLDRRDSLT
jgi:hypothetical protein